MQLKMIRQVFKACGDDTRLRIINFLKGSEQTVKGICDTLQITQTTASKHLAKLRLLRMVKDARVGNLVYYTLNTNKHMPQGKIINFIVSNFKDVRAFKDDRNRSVKTA